MFSNIYFNVKLFVKLKAKKATTKYVQCNVNTTLKYDLLVQSYIRLLINTPYMI